MSCVNIQCDRDPLDNPKKVLWGCDGDFCCNQTCYAEARQQMDALCAAPSTAVEAWLGGEKDTL